MPTSPLSGLASLATSLTPLYSFGLCDAGDLRAAVEPVAAHREIHHVGRHHAVVDDVAALLPRALDERLGQPRRRRAHVARHGDPLGAEVGHEGAADVVRGRFVDLGRVEAPHVIGLEDVRVHDVHVCHASVPGAAGPQARTRKMPARASEPAVVGDGAAIAEHPAVTDDRVAADVAVAPDQRALDHRLGADHGVGPDDGIAHLRLLVHLHLAADRPRTARAARRP